ncbi:uncharacterized protein ColSpa_02005 [Colletotrichum spaethianum]|uniref:Tat pathway signal sequence n=1 Tax=Colletotrichum spaethianum TaxID=700344 RepID=A0AA37P734_9PEZI|nr:uncharacterized protein ColSpa_02005 [Colletotrichum spaethianum]GKT41824.1 hypothetical protein ColSpa_02005 [Colletotrichum spaethianum]
MHKSPAFARTARTTVGRMPVIAEDDSLPSATPSPAPAFPPSPPCRSTKPKPYGRSPTARPIYPNPSYPPPAYSRSPSRESTRSTVSTRSLLSIHSNGSLPNSGTSTPRSSYREKAGLLPTATPTGPTTPEENRRGSVWMARRRGWYRLVIFAVLAIGLAGGLSIGLTIGMRKSQPTAPADASNFTNLFPAGSFAFNTALLEANTGCTSDSSTWQCFPYQTYSQSPNASTATFFWTISQRNSYTYQISSSSNPFSPQFANETMTLLEGNSYNERLVFNFTLPKTVVPSDAITQDGRAATCTFQDTAFRATLWTRRNATTTVPQSGSTRTTMTANADSSIKWGVWPGQVEFVQVKSGGPECKDSAGNAVKVAAGNKQCNCLYANFDFEVQEKRKRWQA